MLAGVAARHPPHREVEVRLLADLEHDIAKPPRGARDLFPDEDEADAPSPRAERAREAAEERLGVVGERIGPDERDASMLEIRRSSGPVLMPLPRRVVADEDRERIAAVLLEKLRGVGVHRASLRRDQPPVSFEKSTTFVGAVSVTGSFQALNVIVPPPEPVFTRATGYGVPVAAT